MTGAMSKLNSHEKQGRSKSFGEDHRLMANCNAKPKQVRGPFRVSGGSALHVWAGECTNGNAGRVGPVNHVATSHGFHANVNVPLRVAVIVEGRQIAAFINQKTRGWYR